MLPILETKAQVRITLVTDSSFLYYCLTKLTNMNQSCLNCNKPTSDNFCSHCGQKTSIHRITFSHFIFHDIIHGVWHFEKGILFTLKEAILRPGKAALDYISGKRIRYYNVFYLTLLLIGLNIYLNHIQDELSHYYFQTRLVPEADTAGQRFDSFLSAYSKLVIFSFIPLFAFNSFLLFKERKLNFSEHFIISGMMFLGVMIIQTVCTFIYFTDYLEYLDILSKIANYATPITILLFLIINYYKTFTADYRSKFEISSRVFLFILFLLIEIAFIFTLLLGYFTNWEYKMSLVY